MKEFILVKINHHELPHIYFKKNSLDFWMATPAFHKKLLGNLKQTPESCNQINTECCTILLIIVMELTEEWL